MKNNKNDKNEIYWRDRLSVETLRKEDELLSTMSKLYADSLSNIEKEIEAFYGRYSYLNDLTIDEVYKRLNPQELKSAKYHIKKYYDSVDKLTRNNKGKVSIEKLRLYKNELRLLSAKAYMSRLEELKINLRHIIVELAMNQEIEFTDSLSDIYENALYKTSFELDKQMGISPGFSAPSKDAITKVIKTKWLEENYSDRIWANKTKLLDGLDTSFLQGITQGQNAKKIARKMAEKYNTDYKNCERLARTESMHLYNEARANTYKAHKIKEFEFVCTLDEKTCPVCGSIDGQVFTLTHKTIGVNYPPMHPNCRCTTVAHFAKDEFDMDTQRIARGSDGKSYYVPYTMTFNEWKNTIVKKNN